MNEPPDSLSVDIKVGVPHPCCAEIQSSASTDQKVLMMESAQNRFDFHIPSNANPKGTSREIIDQISSATRRALAEPDLRQIYLLSGIEPSSDSSPEAATQLLQDEIVRWKPVVKRIHLKLD